MTKNESVREQMFSMIQSWQQSGQSQKAWCQHKEVAYHIFHYWYREYRKAATNVEGGNDFITLSVKPEARSNGCEVVYGDGTRIIFHEPVPVSYLKNLLF